MEIKNLKFMNAIKSKGVALATALVMFVTPSSVHANENDVLDYFMDDQSERIEEILDETRSRDNLEEALETYEKLYKYINDDKKVQSTYYDNLNYYVQNQLEDLLQDWEEDIYDRYEDTSYFKTVSKEVLGTNIKSGNHKETMNYYEDTVNDALYDDLDKNRTVNNLRNALTEYNKLVRFIEGTTTAYGYTFEDLDDDEQMDLFNLAIEWANDIKDEYEGVSYFNSTCINSLKWILSEDNVYKKLGEYVDYNNEGIVYPTDTIIPNIPNNQIYIPNNNINNGINNNVVTVPPVQAPVQTPQGNINNTINKNWFENYNNPKVDTSRRVPDYAPESIEGDYKRYTQEYPYNQGYPYGNSNYYPGYDEYVEDYPLQYIPR